MDAMKAALAWYVNAIALYPHWIAWLWPISLVLAAVVF